MDETPLREQVKVGQGFAREQRRRGFGGPGCVDCGVVPALAWEMIGTAAAPTAVFRVSDVLRDRLASGGQR
jgi:hypothetical protein